MKITKLWFADNRIYVQTNKGEKLYQSLLFYPRLLTASNEEREKYEFWDYGIRWDAIDEDMSYESFYYDDTKEPAPGIQDAFLSNPELNISAVARRMGIQQSLLASYIKGTKVPSPERKKLILDTIHDIGNSLLAVSF
ncbi:DUF2442 domain-containing protein [Bacteroides intestinalis]|uniref:DUF2442 domain-containing protein n=1 Tax=Bacteroides intestinalis TaxID=329854 RepID=UPI000E4DFC42|nr:DUF2442 domain-containing protein [Bacteroides intestinalis]RHA57633.1 DUF2442 domain-containing protein [Bacteroides intestinalis]DAJ80759.1 MAG TPA: Protein of unknown function (DUF2442) [Caudoviricetes sp.]